MNIKSIEELVRLFSTLPGIGGKSAERIVFALLQKKPTEIELMSSNILELNKIKHCKICNTLTNDDVCAMCLDNENRNDVICVVDDIKNIILFEKNKIFDGRYFLLTGLINPIQGTDINDINLNQLSDMIEKFKSTEIFLALKPSIEGETTTLYLSKIFKNKVKVTRLAQGVPLGAEIEYLDPLTIEQAMKDRKEIA